MPEKQRGCECQKLENQTFNVKVPNTITFACPGGDCGCCSKEDKKKKKNNNICEEAPKEEKKSETVDDCECKEQKVEEKPKPKCRPMPKMDCSKCQQKEKTVDACNCEDKKKDKKEEECFEDKPVEVCKNLPDTKTFKCAELDCCKKEEDSCAGDEGQGAGSPPKSTGCSLGCCDKCSGNPVGPRPNCDCNANLPPPPPRRTCGCSKKAPCLPNTSCEVLPLSMKKDKK